MVVNLGRISEFFSTRRQLTQTAWNASHRSARAHHYRLRAACVIVECAMPDKLYVEAWAAVFTLGCDTPIKPAWDAILPRRSPGRATPSSGQFSIRSPPRGGRSRRRPWRCLRELWRVPAGVWRCDLALLRRRRDQDRHRRHLVHPARCGMFPRYLTVAQRHLLNLEQRSPHFRR